MLETITGNAWLILVSGWCCYAFLAVLAYFALKPAVGRECMLIDAHLLMLMWLGIGFVAWDFSFFFLSGFSLCACMNKLTQFALVYRSEEASSEEA